MTIDKAKLAALEGVEESDLEPLEPLELEPVAEARPPYDPAAAAERARVAQHQRHRDAEQVQALISRSWRMARARTI